MTDPIAPYTTDDRCSNIACQPSRVREGYSFELRCSEKDDPPDTLWDRILCCIGDLEEAVKASSDANAVGRFHDKAAFASQQIKINAPVPFEQIDVDVLSQGTQRLQRFTGERQMAAETAEIDIRNGLDDLQSTASAIVRWDLQSNKESLAAKLGAAAENVEAARRAVQTAAPVLAMAAAARITSDRDRVFAEESTGQALKWTKPNATFIETEDVQRKFFAYNAGYSVKSMSSFSSVMIQLRDWLIQAIDKRGLFGDCKLRDEVLTLEIPTNAKTPADTQKAAYSLRKAIVEYFKDCFCAALNPPCLPCDETAVKLACLEVENCEVTEICNLERTFVLSGPAFRYWNPFINLIGRFFEWLCCEFEFKTKEGPTEGTIDIRQHQYFKQTAPASRVLDDQPAILTVARMAGMEPATARLATDLGASMAFMVRDQVDLDPMGLLGDFRGFQIRGGRERTGDDEIVTLRRRVDELDKEVIQLKAKRSRTEKNK
jgi:hypothetical protein